MAMFWVSCPRLTVCVTTRDGIIVGAAPVVQRFVGQRFEALLSWLSKFGQVRHEKLSSSDEKA